MADFAMRASADEAPAQATQSAAIVEAAPGAIVVEAARDAAIVEAAAIVAPDEWARQAAQAARERLALKREIVALRDHLSDLEARLSLLKLLFGAASFLRGAVRFAIAATCGALRCASLLWRWPAALKTIEDARFRSQRFDFDAGQETVAKTLDRAVFARRLRQSFGLSRAPLYAVRLRQRIGLARRPKVLHAIANVWVGGSTQLVVDLHDYLGHAIEMEVVTSALPPRGAHRGMTIRLVPQPASPHLVRSVFSRFRPDLVHIHYWGDVDEAWYRAIFEAAAEFECPVVQNVNTPVAPFAGAPVARNVFVSQSVLDRFGSGAPAEVIHPGVDLQRFAPRPPAPGALDTIGMIYRLENDKLNADAIELFIEVVRRRPATRAIIIGDGSLFAHFRRRVEQEELLERFEFAGFIPYEDLPAELSRFRLFVAPVRQESFGQVIPFAMSAGLAVAGYRIGAVPEILESQETLGDTLDETAAIVVALLDDPKRIEALGRRNQNLALQRFSVETMAARYAACYSKVAPAEFDLAPELPAAVLFPL